MPAALVIFNALIETFSLRIDVLYVSNRMHFMHWKNKQITEPIVLCVLQDYFDL
jgi:hypothetical protein